MLKACLAALLMLAGMGSATATDVPLDASQLLEQGQQAGQAPVLLDVRGADEYRDSHIAVRSIFRWTSWPAAQAFSACPATARSWCIASPGNAPLGHRKRLHRWAIPMCDCWTAV